MPSITPPDIDSLAPIVVSKQRRKTVQTLDLLGRELERFYASQDPAERLRYLWYISELTDNLSDKMIWELLQECRKDEDFRIRGQACILLERSGRHSLIKELEPFLVDANSYVREKATRAQARLSEQASTSVRPENTKTSESKKQKSKDKTKGVHQNLAAQPTQAEVQIPCRALSDMYSQSDLLGYEDYVDALTDLIKSPDAQKPLVIGIDAAWGGGKTSLMHLLEKRLHSLPEPTNKRFWQKKTEGSFLTVWFNAWKYDHEESLWAALILDVLAQVRKQLSFWRRLWISVALNWKRFDWQDLFMDLSKSLALIFAFISIGIVVFFGLAFFLEISWADTLIWLKRYTKVLGGLGLAALLYTVLKDTATLLVSPFNLGISKYLKTPKYKDTVGFLNQFQDDFQRMVDTVTSGKMRPLVIFIDDLDRCTPSKAPAVIEAINMLLDPQLNCVFIIGMDVRILASSIQAKYKDLTDFFYDTNSCDKSDLGRKFLEKITQINFHIPRPDHEHIYKFIDANLGRPLSDNSTASNINSRDNSFDFSLEVEQTVREAAHYLEYNPRKIKRFINSFRLQAMVAHRRKALEKSFSLEVVGKWIIISMCWPAFFEEAVRRPEFVEMYFEAARACINPDSGEPTKKKDHVADPSLAQSQIKPLIPNQDLYYLLAVMPRKPEAVSNYLLLVQVTTSAETVEPQEA